MGQINHEKEKYWREQLGLAEKYDGSLARFCQAKGISPATFGYWRRKFKRSSPAKAVVSAKFVPIEVMAPALTKTRLPDPRWLAEFIGQLSGGYR